MKKQTEISRKVTVFSKWSRKSYAIFASLNKVVKIGMLSIDICVLSLKKLQAIIRLIKLDKIEEIKSDNTTDWEQPLSELLMRLLKDLNLNSIKPSYNLNTYNYFSPKPMLQVTAP